LQRILTNIRNAKNDLRKSWQNTDLSTGSPHLVGEDQVGRWGTDKCSAVKEFTCGFLRKCPCVGKYIGCDDAGIKKYGEQCL
jgi:hypothetical protein